jgi:glycosyltransferase involved in cell wall biosynthesis
MKIAVYTISKNEEKFIDRFCAGALEADAIYVLDTGSTDNTVSKLKENGVTVAVMPVNPWRFDTARNMSLAMVPNDYDICVCVDLDEILKPGWRKIVENGFSLSPRATRLRYKYIWSHDKNGNPETLFWYDKIHVRKGYSWKYPVHEVLVADVDIEAYVDEVLVEHYPDPHKSRGQYLGLLELAAKEDPKSDRLAHYLGREYLFYDKLDEAHRELTRHLSLKSATWDAERAASMLMLAEIAGKNKSPHEQLQWLRRAVAEAPEQREPWVSLGAYYYSVGNELGAYQSCVEALKITERPKSYITKGYAWGALPHDIASVTAWAMGLKKEARKHASKAAELAPDDHRILNNYRMMLGEISDHA